MVRLAIFALVLGACAPAEPRAQFADVTEARGVRVRHHLREELRSLRDAFGGGVCLLDYDGDGDLDLYAVDRAGPDPSAADGLAHDRLLRNDGGAFTDVTFEAGLGETRDDLGCAVGDYDGDGDPDLVVTGDGPVRLLENEAGVFTDVTAALGIVTSGLAQSAAFADVDGDRDVDLFVALYARYDPACVTPPGEAFPCQAQPLAHPPLRNFLFENLGPAGFRDVTLEAGLGGEEPSMAPLFYDLEGDGDVDLFLGNDLGSRYDDRLFVNRGDGTFTDEALARGVAPGTDTMGVALGDVDGDGLLDLVESDFEALPNRVFRGLPDGTYEDYSREAGMLWATALVRWSAHLADFDQDGDLDLLNTAGHVLPEDLQRLHHLSGVVRQPALLFRNTDGLGHFELELDRPGDPLRVARLGRGSAVGDLDGDLDLDVVMVDADGPLVVLENVGARGDALSIELTATRSSPDAIGAEVTVTCGGRRHVQQRTSPIGYLSSSDPRLHFGLGDCPTVDAVEVRWPSGGTERLSRVPANQLVRIAER